MKNLNIQNVRYKENEIQFETVEGKLERVPRTGKQNKKLRKRKPISKKQPKQVRKVTKKVLNHRKKIDVIRHIVQYNYTRILGAEVPHHYTIPNLQEQYYDEIKK